MRMKRMRLLLAVGFVLGIAFAAIAVEAQAAQRFKVTYMAYLWSPHAPNHVWQPAGDPDCDDNYSQWNTVPQNQIIPTNNLGTHSNNIVTGAAITAHWGLDGWFDCANGQCWVRLCNTDAWGSDPWSVRIGSW